MTLPCIGTTLRVVPSSLNIARLTACGTLLALATMAQAQTYRVPPSNQAETSRSASSGQAGASNITPSISVEETLTNNVNLESNAVRRGDLVTQVTPQLSISETGAHSSLFGSIALPILLYARTGSENNKVEPQINLLGNLELADRLLYIEGAVNVNQQYLTPFGPRSESLANATDNRFTGQTYRISPYLSSPVGSNYTYQLRDDNIWTKGNSNVVADTYTNELVGRIDREPRPLGWGIDIDRSDTKFQGQPSQLLELARGRALYQIDPQFLISLSAGYEHNDLLLQTKDDAIYGMGIAWTPTERARVAAKWEHRFFGASYNVSAENRTPLSVWRLVASRDITTYPQQIASLQSGTDVTSALNQLFSSRVPDAAARQALIDQIIRDRGLPSQLSSGVTVYSQQVTLQESLTATAGIVGARNSTFFSVYRLRQQPISGSGEVLPDLLGALQDNTQYGFNVVWTHNLTPLLVLTASVDASRTVDNTQPITTKQGSVRAGLTSPLSLDTYVYGAIRYQILRSNVTTDYNEAAVIVGINHRFH